MLNSTGVLVKWEPVPIESRHGIITHYTIHYKDVEMEKEGEMVVKATILQAIINGLRQKAEYKFWILAATSKGDGPASNAVIAGTKGKRNEQDILEV